LCCSLDSASATLLTQPKTQTKEMLTALLEAGMNIVTRTHTYIHTRTMHSHTQHTLQPKTQTKEMLTALLEAGMNIVRMNFSHGDHGGFHALFSCFVCFMLLFLCSLLVVVTFAVVSLCRCRCRRRRRRCCHCCCSHERSVRRSTVGFACFFFYTD
jgi:hypothetical protein